MPDGSKTDTAPRRSIVVDSFTNSVLDPNAPMLGPVEDGGTIIANTAPGCWGPMITPSLRGGHEVTQPVFVVGAEIGDGVAIRIRDITVTSIATASGHDSSPDGYCLGDPYIAGRCPTCDTVWPDTHIEGIGQDSVKCDVCGNAVTPFEIVHGYTVRGHSTPDEHAAVQPVRPDLRCNCEIQWQANANTADKTDLGVSRINNRLVRTITMTHRVRRQKLALSHLNLNQRFLPIAFDTLVSVSLDIQLLPCNRLPSFLKSWSRADPGLHARTT